MPMTPVGTAASRREALMAREHRLLPYLRFAFVATWRHREARRRMLHAVRELDHSGVLADAQFACGPFRR